MISAQVRTLWTEPHPEHVPPRGWRDWALLALVLIWTVVDVSVRGDLVWRPITLVVGVVVALSLMWRRTHPLSAVVVAFGTLVAVDVATIVGAGASPMPTSVAAAFLLPYALFRWGSGREAVTGLAIILVWLAVTHVAERVGWAEVVGGYAFFLLAAAVGASVRYRASSRSREIDQARFRERDQIARELHDTVAHHISAIAIRAQAGRALANSDPNRATEALDVIEAAATRTLDEMRSMVGYLRDGRQTDLVPQPGIADIERLAHRAGGCPRVDVEMSGELAGISPLVATALYRLTQESIHQRGPARPSRDADPRPHRSRPRRHPSDRSGRRRAAQRRAEPARVRARRHGRTSHTPRRHPRGGPEPRPRLDRHRDAAPNRHTPVTIRVIVADDQELVRTGLTMILDAQPDIEVIGEATNGREAVALAQQLRPDVCLFDIRMPEIDGIEATRQVTGPDVDDPPAVVVITTFDLDDYVHRALKAGARGFLLKGADPALLVRAIHAAADGDALIAPDITARLLTAFADAPTASPPAQPTEPLTTREEEVLTAVARGRTNSEIADELYISLSTVKTHLASLMRKLDARNRVELAMWAYETGRVKN